MIRPRIRLDATVERHPDRVVVSSRWGLGDETHRVTLTWDCPVMDDVRAERATDEQVVAFAREYVRARYWSQDWKLAA